MEVVGYVARSCQHRDVVNQVVAAVFDSPRLCPDMNEPHIPPPPYVNHKLRRNRQRGRGHINPTLPIQLVRTELADGVTVCSCAQCEQFPIANGFGDV